MSGATDAAAVEGVNKLPDEEEKNHVEEEDKNLGEGGGTHIDPDINPEGKEQVFYKGSESDEETVVPHNQCNNGRSDHSDRNVSGF